MNNCAVCGIEIIDHSGMLCDDCAEYAGQEAEEITADAAHDKFVDDCYNAQYDESMY